MIAIPVSLNGAQSDALNALILRGDPDLFTHEDKLNGSPVFVLVARGNALDVVKKLLYSDASPAPEPDVPEQPVVKVIPVRDGISDARPPGR
jgi:hypothetical protein